MNCYTAGDRTNRLPTRSFARLVALLLFPLLLQPARGAEPTFEVGVAWESDSELADRMLAELQSHLGRNAPQIRLEIRPALASLAELEAAITDFEKNKQAMVILRSNGAELLGRRGVSIPAFIGGANNPVELGAAYALDRPKPNISGVTYYIPAKMKLEAFKLVYPAMRNYLLLVQDGHPSSQIDQRETEAAAPGLGLQGTTVKCATPEDAITAIEQAGSDVSIIIGIQPLLAVMNVAARLVEAAGNRPVFSYSEIGVEAGALAGLVPDDGKLGRMLGDMLIDLLVKGTPIDHMPIQTDPAPKLRLNRMAMERFRAEIPAVILGFIQDEMLLESIINTVPGGIGVVANRVFTQVNDYVLDLTGYTREELIGQSARMLYPTQEESDYMGTEKYRQIAERGTGTVESRWLRKDGTIRHVLVSSTPLDQDDLAAGVAFTVLDITDRKQAEERFERLFQLTPTIIGLTSVRDRRFYAINDAFLSVLGYAREEVIGKTAAELEIYPDPEELKTVSELLREFGKVENLEVRLRRRNGEMLTCLFSCDIFELDGEPYFLAVITDITYRKKSEQKLQESEERFRSMFEDQSAVMLLIDPQTGAIRDANPSAAAYYGWPREELTSMSIHEINTLSPEEVLREMQDAKARKRTYFEFRHRRADGSIRDVMVFSSAVRIGEETLLFSEIHDNTDFKAAQAALTLRTRVFLIGSGVLILALFGAVCRLVIALRLRRRAEAALLETNRALESSIERANEMALRAEVASIAKSDFLANMSHEIRTPMNAIIGFADLLSKEISDERQRHQAAIMAKSGQSLLRLINDILDLSKIEAGKLEVIPEFFPLPPLIEELRVMFEPRTQEKRLALRFELPHDFPEMISLDEARLRQILVNLIGNAVKFTEQGGITVRIETVRHKASAAHRLPPATLLRISVTDTGVGVPDEARELIFGAFDQVPDQDHAKYGGTGLGLAISRHLAELMNGEITVGDNPAGPGSVFTLLFRNVYIGAVRSTETAATDNFEMTVSFPSRPTILIVDDISSNLELLRSYLQPHGFCLLEARDGEEGLNLLLANNVDIVLTDIKMPRLDGYDFLSAIRNLEDVEKRKIPVIAVTASLMYLRPKDRAPDFNAVLVKPASRADLLRTIARFLPHTLEKNEAAPGAEPMPSLKISDRARAALSGEMISEIASLKKTLRLSQARQLGERLSTLGREQAIPELEHLGQNLSEAAATYQIDRMKKILHEIAGV